MNQKFFASSHRSPKTNKSALPSCRRSCLLWAGAITLIASHAAQAVVSTWTGLGGNGDWNTLGNWGGAVPLSNASTEIIFAGTNNVGISGTPLFQNIGTPMELNSITFSATAGNFFLNGFQLKFNTATSITQSSVNAQSIANHIVGDSATLTLGGIGTGVVTMSGILSDSNNGSKDLKLVKSGTSTFVLTGANTYTGITSINDGTLVVNGSTAGGAVSVASIAKLFGTGTIGGATTILGTQSSGAYANSVGTQTFSSTLKYDTGSLFEWDINVSGPNAETHDKIVAGTLSGSGAQFKISLVSSGDTFASNFWDATHNWAAAELFGTSNVNANLANIFNSASTTTNFNPNSSQGNFSFTSIGSGISNNLKWTAVPEPTSALAGILLGAGLLRRKRGQRQLA